MTLLLLLLFACAAAGCGGDSPSAPDPVDAGTGSGEPIDAAVPPLTSGTWYRPGLNVTWQWQLDRAIRTDIDAEIYDIDLFDAPDAVIASLHGQGRRVLCYFSAGSFEGGRPDSGRFPSSALGRTLDGYPDERWLDIRRPEILEIMRARLDLARQKGCDGVEPDNVSGYRNNTGFPLTAADQLAFNRNLANEAHRRNLTVALKNSGDQASQLVAYFDLELNEECHFYRECDQLRPFLDAGKPVLNAEYASDAADARRQAASICPQANQRGLRTLILPVDLDASFRVSCF